MLAFLISGQAPQLNFVPLIIMYDAQFVFFPKPTHVQF